MENTIFELTRKWLISHIHTNIIETDPQIQFYIHYIKYICDTNILGQINDIISTTAACVYMLCKHKGKQIPKIKISDISAYYRIDEESILCNYRLVSTFVKDFYKKYACKITYKNMTMYVLCDTSIQKLIDTYKKDGYICWLKHKDTGMIALKLEQGSEYILKYKKQDKNKMYIKLQN